jgi:hypothetical protein
VSGRKSVVGCAQHTVLLEKGWRLLHLIANLDCVPRSPRSWKAEPKNSNEVYRGACSTFEHHRHDERSCCAPGIFETIATSRVSAISEALLVERPALKRSAMLETSGISGVRAGRYKLRERWGGVPVWFGENRK